MINFKLFITTHDNGNHVKTDLSMVLSAFNVFERGKFQLPFFFMVHKVFRLPMGYRTPCFYFNKDKLSLIKSNEVYLCPSVDPILVQDAIAFIFQVFPGKVFAMAAQFIMRCHLFHHYRAQKLRDLFLHILHKAITLHQNFLIYGIVFFLYFV